MYRYGIIAIGYKNRKGMLRLLEYLKNAEYDSENVTLIISVDKSEDDSVGEVAMEFEWCHGEKIVCLQKERMGLRRHILTCGNYLNEYELDAAAVFEDDVIPSTDYFLYMRAAVEKYYNEEKIAGISLYTHRKNFNVEEEFTPAAGEGDTYFLQYAQSWGQVWLRNRWNEFSQWYKDNCENLEADYRIPANVSSWNENSWLKFHIKYCIVKNKYFVYPYVSHSTCFSEAGEHTAKDSDRCQVVLSNSSGREFTLTDFEEKALKYDAFFENEELYQYCGVAKEELTVDLYGGHVAVNRRYLLSKKYLPYPVVKSWGNRLKPHEMNVIKDIPGEDIFLYDLGEGTEWKVLPAQKINVDKFKQYFQIFDKWFCMKEQGRSIETFFKENGYKTIALYGYGKMGKHLLHDLKNTFVQVKYVIDQYAAHTAGDVEIKRQEDILAKVDAVIVTATFDFERIKHQLSGRNIGKIISMEEIFWM